MPAPTLENIRQLPDFVTTAKWNLIIEAFPTGLPSPPTTEQLNFRCESIVLPKWASNVLSAKIRNWEVGQPGKSQIAGTTDIVLYETSDSVLMKFLDGWSGICQAPKTGIQVAREETKCNIIVERLNRQQEPIYRHKIKGAFISTYDIGSVNEEDDFFKPTMTLNYDDFENEAQ